MPLNMSGLVAIKRPQYSTTSCCSTAWITSYGCTVEYITFCISEGVIGLSKIVSRWPITPTVICLPFTSSVVMKGEIESTIWRNNELQYRTARQYRNVPAR
uniref:Uncharacterized protein n=1 Tax=Anopheles christyi TaxID=43041 RepID=A0A182KIJ1_9DIPT